MPRFYALDFDRTLGHTKNIATEFTDHVGESDASAADVLRSTQRDVEASGGSFDIFSTLRTHMGGRALGELVDGFYERPQRVPFLEDGARPLLDGITAKGHQAGILTYGGKDWQKIKLKATDLLDKYPHMIMSEKGIKGALIASWYDEERGLYVLPEQLGGGEYSEIALVDDKPTEFNNFPEAPSARGYLFTGGAKPGVETSPQPVVGDLPPNVRTVNSLHDIIEQEEL